MSCLRIAMLLLVLSGWCAHAQQGADKRVALVIGNAAYLHGPLANPVNDARAMRDRLQSLGFEVVFRENMKTSDLGSVYREFRNKIVPGGVALVFYAGHGVQFKGQNYFPTTDASIEGEEDVPLQSLHLGTLLDNMEEAKSGVSLVFLDACRDNPFARRFRSASRGLAKVEAASGTLIHYATKPGSVASDGKGKNGTYTEALLAQISEPGVPVEQMLKRVTTRVVSQTSGKQEPWVEGSLRGDFYFIFQGPTTVQVGSGAAADPEAETWAAAKRAGTTEAYQAYKKSYPSGRYVGAADIELANLQRQGSTQPQKVAPVTSPLPTDDPETALWNEVKASGLRDYFLVYLKQYPKGKYLALAKMELGKLDDQDKAVRARQENERKQAEEQAKAEQARAEQQAWNSAKAADTPESYTAFLNSYPQGRYAALAEVARQKVQREAASRERQAATEAGKVVKDCDVCPEMVVIPAGSFNMGSNDGNGDEKPVHNVNISSFLMGKTEVTQGQWRSVMGSNPSHFKDCGDDCPVEQVSWNEAQDYAQKLSQKTGKRYRLPSEAEWEYAARAGSQGKWSFGDSENKLGSHAWYRVNSNNTTHKVGQKRVNAFGLYDMHGNVWEWVVDVWHANYNGAPSDGSAWTTGGDQSLRVLRGGSWSIKPANLRSANRSRDAPDNRFGYTGLRLARTN